jgi:two-component system nitrate/nitrite response regulator NarL
MKTLRILLVDDHILFRKGVAAVLGTRSDLEVIGEEADGYLLKNLEPGQLFEMLDCVRRGEAAVSGSLAAKILNEFRRTEKESNQPTGTKNDLTNREIQVLEFVVQGATNKEIATALSIAEDTVKIHLRNILEKLHLQNRIQAAVYAVRQGLVPDTNTEDNSTG